MTLAVWPDSTSFWKILGQTFTSYISNLKSLWGSFEKKIFLKLRTALATFCATFGKFWLLFISTSGHTHLTRVRWLSLFLASNTFSHLGKQRPNYLHWQWQSHDRIYLVLRNRGLFRKTFTDLLIMDFNNGHFKKMCHPGPLFVYFCSFRIFFRLKL